MNYSSFIGKNVIVWFKNPRHLNYSTWKNYNYPIRSLCGTVTKGTDGIVVIEEEKTKLTYRVNDELIVFFEELENIKTN